MKKIATFFLICTLLLSLFCIATSAAIEPHTAVDGFHPDEYFPTIVPGQHCTDELICTECGGKIVSGSFSHSLSDELIHNIDTSIPCGEIKLCEDCWVYIGGHSTCRTPCTEPQICVYCGQTLDPKDYNNTPARHDNYELITQIETIYVEGIGEVEKEKGYQHCLDCGAMIPTPELADPEDPAPEGCQHEWQEATCTTPKTCKLCGETEGEAVPGAHPYPVTADVRCYDRVCPDCGEIQAHGCPDLRKIHPFDENAICEWCGKSEFELFGNHICPITPDPECHICHRKDNTQPLSYCETFGHTAGAEATETTAQTCTVCGAVLKEATGKGNPHTSDSALYAAAFLALAAVPAVLLRKKAGK